jgi:hypothetical protein
MRASVAGGIGSARAVRASVTIPSIDTRRVAVVLSSLRGCDDRPRLVFKT